MTTAPRLVPLLAQYDWAAERLLARLTGPNTDSRDGERVRVMPLSVRTVLTDPDLDVPTTATLAAGRLWAVNARFGTTPTATTRYDVVQVPLR